MKTQLYNYSLPIERIAQKLCVPRDLSKLLLCQLKSESIEGQKNFSYQDSIFSNIADLLTPDDFLVLNNAKVLPVRLLGYRIDEKGRTGGKVEALLLKNLVANEWAALLHLSAKVKPGLKILFDPGLIAEILSTSEESQNNQGEVRLKFSGIALERMSFEKWLENHGHVPLPPYVERKENSEDRSNYQTVYASRIGSAAAPTAGFHFTSELLSKLQDQGVETGYVTLHVGLGTFRPIKVSHIEKHVMHEEIYEISTKFLSQYMQAKQKGKRIVAVGTTVVRALESWVENENLSSGLFATNLFIRPGYSFKVVDDLITNFHLPKSTLLVLVAALMGIPSMQQAYQYALAHHYRFFSYGDAMFIRGLDKGNKGDAHFSTVPKN